MRRTHAQHTTYNIQSGLSFIPYINEPWKRYHYWSLACPLSDPVFFPALAELVQLAFEKCFPS